MTPKLWLIGMMSSGKTKVGRRLSERSGFSFVDVDDEIVVRAGMTIPQIFATQGEPAFRTMESEEVAHIAGSRQRLVVATGGDMILDGRSRRLMRETGLVVWPAIDEPRRVTMPQMWPHPPQPGPYRPEPSKRPQYDTLESPRRMGYVDRMDTNRDTDLSAGEIEKVYCIRVTRGNGQMGEQLAAAMEEVYESSLRDPNSWDNNPDKQRAALKGLGKLLDEWEAENGAFTEEELACARALKSGAIVRS